MAGLGAGLGRGPIVKPTKDNVMNDSITNSGDHRGAPMHRTGPAIAVLAAFLGGALVMAAPAAAQDERIAGIWQKDHTRSDADWPHRHDRRPANPPDVEIGISLEGEDVVLIQTSRRSDWPAPHTLRVNYVTNNRPNPAPNLRSGNLQEVRARWRKKKLTVSYTITFPFEVDVEETWQISKDGKDLVQTIVGRAASSERPDVRRNYYVRATAVQ